MIELRDFNAIPRVSAIEELQACCGVMAWCERMADARPFPGKPELFEAADRIWFALDAAAWRETFVHHPRIGGLDELRKKFSATAKWAGEEQGGVAHAEAATLAALAEGNRAYEARYGYIFLVCATGKSASEMLGILTARMVNSPDAELRIAAAEQAKITRLRLEKLIS